MNKRRDFLKKATVSMGALGMIPASVLGKDLEFPNPEFPCEQFYLWKDGSDNNGTKPDFRPGVRIYYPEFLPKANKKLSCILVCPGGGYYTQAPHEGVPLARLFSLYGIVGAVLTYRVFPDYYPGSFSDATRAIRMLRRDAEKYNIDPERIGIMGFSAGGHLASTVATLHDHYKNPGDDLAGNYSARPDRVILGYPVISFTDDFAHTGSARGLLGENPDPGMLKKLTNYLNVKEDSPPAFLFHAADDEGVPVENSLRYAEACVKNKVPVELHVFPKGGHGMGMALYDPSLSIWTENLMSWLGEWHYRP